MATKEATAPRVCCSPHIPAAGEGVGDVAPDLWKAKEGARAGGGGGWTYLRSQGPRGLQPRGGEGVRQALGVGAQRKIESSRQRETDTQGGGGGKDKHPTQGEKEKTVSLKKSYVQ